MLQMQTEAEAIEQSGTLSGKQLMALQRIGEGLSFKQIAEEVGVSRSTLHRWRTQEPRFVEAMQACQGDAVAEAQTRLASMADAALDVVQAAIKGGDAKLALQVLRMLGIHSKQPAPAAQRPAPRAAAYRPSSPTPAPIDAPIPQPSARVVTATSPAAPTEAPPEPKVTVPQETVNKAVSTPTPAPIPESVPKEPKPASPEWAELAKLRRIPYEKITRRIDERIRELVAKIAADAARRDAIALAASASSTAGTRAWSGEGDS